MRWIRWYIYAVRQMIWLYSRPRYRGSFEHLQHDWMRRMDEWEAREPKAP